MVSPQTILGIDPGLRTMGIAVLGSRARLLHGAVLTSPRTLSLARRFKHLADQLEDLLARYKPDLVALEATWPSKNPSLALLHRVGKLCERRVTARRIRMVSVPSATVRRHLLGDGWATKRDTAKVIASVYPELRIYLRQNKTWKEHYFENLFDAVAVALYAHQTRRRSS